MKIVSLKIKNIASLKGEHFIDFDQILTHSGVFAITGETGSGKSTILNCISLALYGQHYKKSNNQVDFVTLGESDGEIDLTYKIENIIYKAFWHMRLKKSDGNYLKKPQQERRFSKFTENKWQTIETSPEETLHLSFEQFSKTIVLNQGEFAKFLSSGFKDRKEILSKLYDGEKLEQLSIHVRRKIGSLKNEVETINAQILGINENTNFSLDDAKKLVKDERNQKEALEHINNNLENALKKLNELYKHKENWHKNLEHIKRLKINLSHLTEDFNKIKIDLKDVEESLSRLKKELKFKEPLLIQCISKKKIINEKNQSINKLKITISETNSSIKSEELHIKDLVKNNEDFSNKIKKIKTNELFSYISINDIEKALIANQNSIKTNNELKLLNKENDIYQIELKQLSEKGDKLNIEKSSLEKRNLNELIQRQKREDDTLTNSIDDYKKAQTTLESYIIRINDIHKEESDNQELLKSNDEKILNSEDEIKVLKQRVRELELAIKSFGLQEYINEISKASISQGECLVCHASELTNIKVTNISDQNEREQLQLRYKNKNSELRTLEIESQGLRSSQAHYRGNIQKLKHESIELTNSIISKFTFLKKDELVKNPKQSLAEIKELIKSTIIIADELKLKLERTQKETQVLKNLTNNLKELRQSYKAKSAELTNLETKIISTKNVYESLRRELIFLLGKEYSSDLINEKILLIKDYNVFQQRIQDNNKSMLNSNERYQSLLKTKHDSETNLESSQKLIIQLEDYLIKNSEGNPEDELSQIKFKNEMISEKVNKIQQKANDYKVKIAEDSSKQKNYLEQCEQTENIFKIISVDLCKVCSQVINTKIAVKNTDFLTRYNNFFDKLNKKFNIQDVDILILQETINFNQSLLKEIQQKLIDLTHDIVKNETLISQKQSAQEKVVLLNKEIEKLNQNKTELEDLYELVGKDEFRNFVLSLIEKNLITQTNHELKYLCDDRYLIQHFSKNVQSMPDFYVIDKFKAGLTRKVSTLSGGETFMVSLAMALALAELTRGTSEVDSFFIDEGFGTLDDDSLEDVLDMINTMEQRGKSIGLISHIKKLTNRIGVNIRLEKSEFGNSSICVLYN